MTYKKLLLLAVLSTLTSACSLFQQEENKVYHLSMDGKLHPVGEGNQLGEAVEEEEEPEEPPEPDITNPMKVKEMSAPEMPDREISAPEMKAPEMSIPEMSVPEMQFPNN